MQNSIHTPLSGSIAQERVLEIIANNLANVNTVGYKGDQISFTLLEPEPYEYKEPLPPANYQLDLTPLLPLHGNDIAYVGVSGVHRDASQGPAIQTDNPLDLMIEGEGMFAFQTPNGVRYSRNGSLSLNRDGAIVSKQGDPIMGEKGAIFVQQSNLSINQKGEVYQNNQLVDRIVLHNFADESGLERAGGNYYFFGGSPQDLLRIASPKISQGYLEGSNVNAIKNLTAMIVAHRSFEAYQKAISNYDKMMEKSSNSLGDVRV